MKKTLICITTCNRLTEVKKYIWDYIAFCNQNSGFDFLLALDGKCRNYLSFCNDFHIPLLYSEEREGVGLSKNRVLKQFPDYEYYFFIEDDIELINPAIFNKYIQASQQTGFEHLNHFRFNSKEVETKKVTQALGYNIESKMFGGGYFNFFTKKGIETVGGFHDYFAQVKRYGHTEHTLRFVNAGLQEYPFNGIREASKDLLIHFPPHVTPVEQKKFKNGISDYEQNIIDEKINFYPIKTISLFHFNGFDMSHIQKVDLFFKKNKQKYPLTHNKERRIALAEHYFLRIRTTRSLFKKGLFFIKSMVYFPINTPMKHWLKTKILRHAK